MSATNSNGSNRKIKVSKHGKILTIRKSTRRVEQYSLYYSWNFSVDL